MFSWALLTKLNCFDFYVLKGQSHDKVCLCKIFWLPVYDTVVCGGAHTKLRFTKCRITKRRITKHRITKRRQDKTPTLQNGDFNKTSTWSKLKFCREMEKKIREKYDTNRHTLYTILEHIMTKFCEKKS
jgi:hypothetical protein